MKPYWTWTCNCGFDDNRNDDEQCRSCGTKINCSQAGGCHDYDGDGLCDRGCGHNFRAN